mgnify:CR=1 FL=1
MTSSIKSLPFMLYDFVVHFLSGVILLTGIFYEFNLFQPLKYLIEQWEITTATIDDILFVLVFMTLAYTTGHLISSFSAQVIQENLDRKHPRPFNYYFRPDEHKPDPCYTFLFILLCFPLFVSFMLCFFNKKIKKSYYDKWVTDDKNSKEALIKKLDEKKWFHALIRNQGNKKELSSSSFHLLESHSKSNPAHHSEIIYGHLIQYSFSRNLSFVFSVLFIFKLISLLYKNTGSHCLNFYTSFNQLTNFNNLLFLSILFILSIGFFLRFLDQYKRYTREIYLTFMTTDK